MKQNKRQMNEIQSLIGLNGFVGCFGFPSAAPPSGPATINSKNWLLVGWLWALRPSTQNNPLNSIKKKDTTTPIE